jgi:acetyltransferase-like isoleucine patch superfamily enzyme
MYRFLALLFQLPRIIVYRILSQNRCLRDRGARAQPVLILGKGKVTLGKCNLGIWPSPFFFTGYVHIEARTKNAEVTIADDVWINNNAIIIASAASISIGKGCLIGPEFCVFDSDFHEVDPKRRNSGAPKGISVAIAENVFIGSRVTVLKGVSIGPNSVIGSGSVVTTSIPPNCIAAGVPAKIIRALAT